MDAVYLVLPLFLMRFGLMRFLNKEAPARADFFPPVKGLEVMAFWVYQATNLFLFVSLFFFKIRTDTRWFLPGVVLYLLGLVLYGFSVVSFSRPNADGMNANGLYKVSRNPMYVAYFIFFLGCGLLIYQWPYLLVLLVFQLSVHWMILSEERWCLEEFGEEYREYMNSVGRYLGMKPQRNRVKS